MGSSAGEGSLATFVVFLDENHCRNPHLLAALRDAGVAYERHLDHFPAGVEDVVWLPEVGRRGWTLLTTDKRIRSHVLERESVRENFVRMFYFSTNNVSGAQMGVALRRALPDMQTLFETVTAPFAASINKNGDVKLRDNF
jgi:hypothetical protein